MIALAFLKWWYGVGWLDAAQRLKTALARVGLAFSVPALLRTLFSPWRRIVSYPGASLADHARAMLDNLVSRCIGFVVRLFVLLAAGVSVLCMVLLGALGLMLWPLLPVLPLVGLVGGIIG